MARKKMRKFSDGGSDKYKARYDRKVADIESDYKKAQARKTGRAAEVAKAKYEQRMADAKDDLAKWTKSDRTQTRAAESAAEKNLSMTRKFGARSSEGLVNKAEEKLASKAPLSSVDTSSVAKKPIDDSLSFAQKFRMERDRLGGGKTFTWRGKSYSTNMAGEGASRPAASRPTAKPTAKPEAKPEVKSEVKAAAAKLGAPASLSLANKGKNVPTPRPIRERAVDYLESSAAKKRAAEKTNFQDKLFNMLGRGSDADARLAQQYRNQMERDRKYKAAVAAREAQGNKKGGTVKKYKTGGPVMESKRKPIDTRRSVLGSDKDIIARGNRTPYEPIPKTGPDKPKQKPLGRAGKAGFKSGGDVMTKRGPFGDRKSIPTAMQRSPFGSRGAVPTAMQRGPFGSRGIPTPPARTPLVSPTRAPVTTNPVGSGGAVTSPAATPSTTTPAAPINTVGLRRPMKKGGSVTKKGKSAVKKEGNVMKKSDKAGRALVKKSADTMGRAMKKYAKGGSIDGCAIKGKTKAKHVKMNKGGYC